MKNTSRACQEESFATRNNLLAGAGTILLVSKSTETFLANLEILLKRRGWSNRTLGKKADIADRTIGMYRKREISPTLERAERIAEAFGFELWQMQMPDFVPDLFADDRVSRLYHAYLDTDDEGRKVMETTAEFVTSHKKSQGNDGDGSAGGNEASAT